MRKSLQMACGTFSALFVLSAAYEVFACTPPPPPPPWMTAAQIEAEWNQRILDSQIGDWSSAATVFIARVESKGTVALGRGSRGRRAVLAPVLQIKGPDVERRIRVQHTGFLCGANPALDALDENADGYFMVYAFDEKPSASSVFATTALDRLIDPNALEAWRSAYDRRRGQ
ncbi:hypothetical protein [Brevundimonas nasdae]|uniref:Lipoprotein n=1 Tax=Brevundimonas nasdae TaxID=172043 RepID=A0ABX8TFB0_9CAUL|nr:hypothetical protein [Brevundimonas nasdae]QYC09877.1 hypothetical protein KWG56_15060 [Brevundimonas nasdae]QYC12666.1 hypothetical protein KWG63_10380 [Brevundimonas nasdae]